MIRYMIITSLNIIWTSAGYLSVVCFFAWLSSFPTVILGPRWPHFAGKICFPLSGAIDVVADSEGRIYIALSFYGRVQVYDPQGQFMYGFFVDAGGGTFRLDTRVNGSLVVVPARGGKLHLYDQAGNLLSSEKSNDEVYKAVKKRHLHGSVDANGNRYLIHARFLNPHVICSNPDANVTLTICTPVVLWPLIGPIICFVSFLVSILICYLCDFWMSNYRTLYEGCGSLFGGRGIRRHDVLLRNRCDKCVISLSSREGVLYRESMRCDIVLTHVGLCWSRSVMRPYTCIACPNMRARVERRGFLNPKSFLIIASHSDPSLVLSFTPSQIDKWTSELQRLGIDVDLDDTALNSSNADNSLLGLINRAVERYRGQKDSTSGQS